VSRHLCQHTTVSECLISHSAWTQAFFNDFVQITNVNPIRFLILVFGPFVVIGVAYVIAFPLPSSANVATMAPQFVEKSAKRISNEPREIARRCIAVESKLRVLLPEEFHFLVRPPYVLAGDVSQTVLKQLYAEIIDPVSQALGATFFEREPQQPVSIVICSTEQGFRRLARDWDGRLESGYHGYYQRNKRRILLDLEAGNGSLAHELTHALSQADCEHLPEWFDEGLGALHEDATFSETEVGLIGLPNWRCGVTQRAQATGQLPSLEDLTQPGAFRTGNVEIRYAMARSLCLFLQSQKRLVPYYKAMRNRPSHDPSGLKALRRILRAADVQVVEQQFREWIRQSSVKKVTRTKS